MPTGTKRKEAGKKADKKVVNIFIVLDKSGSMLSRTDDTIDAVNNFLNEQAKDQSTRALVSMLLFSTKSNWLAKEVNIAHVDKLELNRQNYICDGNTGLYDAVGRAASEAQKTGSSDGIVVIVTDGGENASTEFTLQAVKDIIMQMEQRGWSFIFLGADVNAWHVGAAMGVGAVHGVAAVSSAPYTPQAPAIAFAAASDSVSRYRSSTADLAERGATLDTSAISLRKMASVLTDEERARLNANAAGSTTTPPAATPTNTTSTNTTP